MSIGEGDAPGVPVEEANADLAFEPLDALRQRWLGHPQVLRSVAEVTGLGDSGEEPQVT